MNFIYSGSGLPSSEAFALSLFDSLWQGAFIVLCVWCFRFLFRKHLRVQYMLSVVGLIFIFTCSIFNYFEFSFGGLSSLVRDSFFNAWADRTGLLEWFYVFWFLGAGLFLLRFLFSHLYLKRLIGQSQVIYNENWRSTYENIKLHFHLEKEILLLHSDRITSAFITGVLKPVILIPSSWVSGLSLKETECILAHEIAHIRSKDHWINLLAQIAEIIYFFNPAVHILISHIKLDREVQADQFACRYTGAPLFYAKLLLHIEETGVQAPAWTLAFFGQKRQLSKRVECILQLRTLQRPQHLTLICMVFLSGFLFFGKKLERPIEETTCIVEAKSCNLKDLCIGSYRPVAESKKQNRHILLFNSDKKVKTAMQSKGSKVIVKQIHLIQELNDEDALADLGIAEIYKMNEMHSPELKQNVMLVMASSKLNSDSVDFRHLGGNLILSTKPKCYAPSESKVLILNTSGNSKVLEIELEESLEPGVWMEQSSENIP